VAEICNRPSVERLDGQSAAAVGVAAVAVAVAVAAAAAAAAAVAVAGMVTADTSTKPLSGVAEKALDV